MSKPIYAGPCLSFGALDRTALGLLLREIKSPFKKILEVGSWLGPGSTTTVLKELAGQGELSCVDTWRGSPNVKTHHEMTKAYDVFGTFLHNVTSAGGQDLVKPMVMSSKDAASIISDGTFDLVFIDADHSYAATREDIRLWLPKVRPGGILCGHDCEIRVTDANRERLRSNSHADAIAGNEQFEWFHPGVVLAVDEFFGQRCRLWSEEILTAEDGTRGGSTIWSVRVE